MGLTSAVFRYDQYSRQRKTAKDHWNEYCHKIIHVNHLRELSL